MKQGQFIVFPLYVIGLEKKVRSKSIIYKSMFPLSWTPLKHDIPFSWNAAMPLKCSDFSQIPSSHSHSN